MQQAEVGHVVALRWDILQYGTEGGSGVGRMEALGFPCCAAPLQAQPPCIMLGDSQQLCCKPTTQSNSWGLLHATSWLIPALPLHAADMVGKEMGCAQCSLKQSYGYFSNNQRPINSGEALQQALCN